MMLVFIIPQVVFAIIQYDSELATVIVSLEECHSGKNLPKQISFSGTFANIPQIILVLEKFDISHGTSEFQLQTTSITTSNYELQATCPSNKIHQINVRWYAIDDKRIEVINQFNIIDFTSKTIPHSNPNAQTGFISLVSFGFSGAIDFNIEITEITTNTVTTSIAGVNNLKSLGYQIILGTADVINIHDVLKLTANYLSPPLTVQADSWFMIPDKSLTHHNTFNIRQLTNYIQQNPLIYEFNYWGEVFTPVTQQQIWFKYKPQFFYGLFCDQLIVTLGSETCTANNRIELYFVQLNTTFNQIGKYPLQIDKSIPRLNFQLHIICSVNSKLNNYYNMCYDCIDSSKTTNLNQKCTTSINSVKYKTGFSQKLEAYKQINIEITETSISITQTLLNQIESTIILQKIEIQPI